MKKYIELEAAIKKIRDEGIYGEGHSDEERENNVIEMLECLPGADVVSRAAFDQVMWERDVAIQQLREDYGVGLGEKKAADVVERKRGEWVYEAQKENSNYGWNVTAECSECCGEKKVVWRGLFPGVPDWHARNVALQSAESVKLSNFCPNCGADMRRTEEPQ